MALLDAPFQAMVKQYENDTAMAETAKKNLNMKDQELDYHRCLMVTRSSMYDRKGEHIKSR